MMGVAIVVLLLIVGILEGFKGKCTMSGDHEAFAALAATDYLTTPLSCTLPSHGSCTGGGSSACVGGQCRATASMAKPFAHTTAVASRIAGRAASANLTLRRRGLSFLT